MTNPDTKALREALLPCPFCNSGMSSFAGMTPDAFSKCTDGTLSISCDCGASGPLAPTMEEAIAAWNRRVPLDRSDELDRVKAENATLKEKLSGVEAENDDWQRLANAQRWK